MNPLIVSFVITFGLQQHIVNYRNNQRLEWHRHQLDQNLKQTISELQNKFIQETGEMGVSLGQFIIVRQAITMDIIKENLLSDDIQKPNFRTELFLPTYETEVVENLNQKESIQLNPYTQLSSQDMKKLPNFKGRFYNGPNVNNVLLFESGGIIHLIQGVETEESCISQFVEVSKVPFNGIIQFLHNKELKKKVEANYMARKLAVVRRTNVPLNQYNTGYHTHALAYKSNRNAMVVYNRNIGSTFLEIYDFDTNQQKQLTSIDLNKYSIDGLQIGAQDLFFVGGNTLFLRLFDKLYKIILPNQKDGKSDTDIGKEALFQKVADNIAAYAIDPQLPIGFMLKKRASEKDSNYPVYTVNLTTGKYKQIAAINAICPGCHNLGIIPYRMTYDGCTLGINFYSTHKCAKVSEKNRSLLATIPLSIYKLKRN